MPVSVDSRETRRTVKGAAGSARRWSRQPRPPPLSRCHRRPSSGSIRLASIATLQPLLTSISNLAPFALFDVLIAARSWSRGCVAAVRDVSRAPSRPRGALPPRLAHGSPGRAALYLLFLALWGLNYRASSHARCADVRRVRGDGRRRRCRGRLAVVAAQRAVRRAHARTAGRRPTTVDANLADGVRARGARRGRPRATSCRRGRSARCSIWYFRRAGVDGMTDPFFLETLVAGELLPFERPFVVAHEWSHLAGHRRRGRGELRRLADVRRAARRRTVQRLAVPVRRARRAPCAPRDRAALAARARRRGRARTCARSRPRLRAQRQPARVRGRVARLRLVPEGQSRRGGRGELRRGRAARARRAVRRRLDAAADVDAVSGV